MLGSCLQKFGLPDSSAEPVWQLVTHAPHARQTKMPVAMVPADGVGQDC